MTQMESPKRKMQKKNDYQRHKLFRKIKRRRKAQAEAEQHIAEKQLRKKLKLPKFDTGDDARMVYLRDIVGHDPYTGQDILKTGERVNRRLSEVNVDQRDLSKVDAAERNKELRDLREYMGDAAFDKYMSNLYQSKQIANSGKTLAGYAADGIDAGMAIGSFFPETNLASDLYFALRGAKQLSNGDYAGIAGLAPIAVKSLPNAYKIANNYMDNVYRRGAEVAMRTSANPDPTNPIKLGLNNIKAGRNGGYPRLFNIANYIITGAKNGPKGYYNSLGETVENINNKTFMQRLINPDIQDQWYYTGFTNLHGEKTPAGANDMIDAFLYQKEIDPRFGLKLHSIGDQFGIHKNYILNNYANKMHDIPVYITTPPKNRISNQQSVKEVQKIGVSGDDVQDFNTYENFRVNAGGHIRVLGEYGEPSKNAFYSQDIWKFNPKDYTQKWGVGSKIKSWGLKKIDKLGTPVITRSEWEEAPTFDNWYQAGHYQSGKDIHIKKSKRGTFTKAAKQYGMSVQGFANRILRNPSKYSSAMRKKANFARNASKWNK